MADATEDLQQLVKMYRVDVKPNMAPSTEGERAAVVDEMRKALTCSAHSRPAREAKSTMGAVIHLDLSAVLGELELPVGGDGYDHNFCQATCE